MRGLSPTSVTQRLDQISLRRCKDCVCPHARRSRNIRPDSVAALVEVGHAATLRRRDDRRPAAALTAAVVPTRASAMQGYLGGLIWSPDGTRIAFAGDYPHYGVYVMNARTRHVRHILVNTSALDLSWSPDGRRFTFAAYPKRRGAQIWTVAANGHGRRNLTKKASRRRSGNDYSPVWSPDGKRIAFERNGDIAVMTSSGRHLRHLTHDRVFDLAPEWSPDGHRIAFLSVRGGCCPNPGDEWSYDLYVIDADGTNLRRLTDDAAISAAPVWSPDSSTLAYSAPSGGDADIFVVDVASAVSRDVTRAFTNESEPAWSPNGRLIAYQVDAPGRDDAIYTTNLAGTDSRRLSTPAGESGDSYPAWSPDGRRIAFLHTRYRSNGPLGFIYSIRPDGTGQRRLSP